LSFNIFLIK